MPPEAEEFLKFCYAETHFPCILYKRMSENPQSSQTGVVCLQHLFTHSVVGAVEGTSMVLGVRPRTRPAYPSLR